MTFNVLVGGEDRFERITRIVTGERPDVLVLQECVGWSEDARLATLADALGVPRTAPHTVLGRSNPRPSGARYDVAVLSRAPITAQRTHTQPPLAHCIVEAESTCGRGEKLVTFGVHLTSRDEDERLGELRVLESVLARHDLARDAVVVVGDLNALSRDDPYPADLDDALLAAGIDKHGHPPRFDVTDRLRALGLVDALRARPAGSAWATGPRERNSVRVAMRTDYVLLSPSLAPRLESAWVVDVGTASDHHAVVAVLADAPAGA